MQDIYNSIVEWIKSKPKWLQLAFYNISTGHPTNDIEYELIKDICFNESNGIDFVFPEIVDLEKVKSIESLDNKSVIIVKVSNIEGINILNPRVPLELFDTTLKNNICIIYGENGTGKSGYVRTLKHMCSAKYEGQLLPNIFNPQSEQKCKIKLIINENEKEIDWNKKNGKLLELSGADILDSNCAELYITQANEVTYEPKIMRTFTILIDEVCYRIRELLISDKNKHIASKLTIPDNISKSSLAIWYSKLDSSSFEEFEKISDWNSENEEALNSYNSRIAEKNPKEKSDELLKQIGNILTFIKACRRINYGLNEINLIELNSLEKDFLNKSKIAEDFVSNTFNTAPLNGVGTESWKLLWKYAKEYSQQYAYRDKEFPFLDEASKCVLCQQDLDDEGKERFKLFKEYISGKLESDSEEANTKFKAKLEQITKLPTLENFQLQYKTCLVNSEKLSAYFELFFTSASNFSEELKNSRAKAITFNFQNLQENILELIKVAKGIRIKASDYLKDSLEIDRGELLDKIQDLNAKKWLFENRVSIKSEIESYKVLSKYQKAIDSTDTSTLTRKKSELSKVIITEEFQKRFATELKALGLNTVEVKLEKTEAQRGHILHRIVLENGYSKLQEILSEGEFRVISIAAFLADVTQKLDSTPFIFDDPITSLDIKYEEKVAERLTELAKTRQVIVFTHRLSLVANLREKTELAHIKEKVISLSKESWGCGEPNEDLFKLGKSKAKLNDIKNNMLIKAKKILELEGSKAYEFYYLGIINQIRITIEYIIEKDLLSDIVSRFRRKIITQNKLKNLTKIKSADCEILENLMTKYSFPLHSQSTETPIRILQPEEIDKDLENLINWLEDFNDRSA